MRDIHIRQDRIYIEYIQKIKSGYFMPLYVKDPEVDKLLDDFLLASGQRSKTEAIRQLLSDGLRRLAEQESLAQRVSRLQDEAAALGFCEGEG